MNSAKPSPAQIAMMRNISNNRQLTHGLTTPGQCAAAQATWTALRHRGWIDNNTLTEKGIAVLAEALRK